MSSKPRIRRNQSRIEFLANVETVDSLLEQGFDRKRIFECLQGKGAFSMGYSTFCKIFTKMRPQHPPTPRLSSPAETKPALPAPQTSPVPAAPRSGPQILGKMDKANPADPRIYAKQDLIHG